MKYILKRIILGALLRGLEISGEIYNTSSPDILSGVYVMSGRFDCSLISRKKYMTQSTTKMIVKNIEPY